MVNINLKQLEAFVTVADCGSFTEAAEQLYVAQSTVSGHIRALEEELGSTLILRSGKRKLSLTESGFCGIIVFNKSSHRNRML